MCGFVAGFGFDGLDESLTRGLERGANLISHRGPDGSAAYIDQRFMAIHHRLSIVDLEERSSQPMIVKNRYVVVFNGEIYNYREIRKRLEEGGEVFETMGDTEVAAKAWIMWGVEGLRLFNGMWAMVVYDRETESLMITRDRFGIKPLFYMEIGESLVFSSEIKGLMSFISRERLEYCIGKDRSTGSREWEEETLVDGIRRFPTASYWVVNGSGETGPRRYWQEVRRRDKNRVSSLYVKRKAAGLVEILRDAVKTRLESDARATIAVSGGIDSSAIACLASRISSERVELFSTVYTDRDEVGYSEEKYIKILENNIGSISNRSVPTVEDYMLEARYIAAHMDLPYEGSCMGGWTNFKNIRKCGFKVSLDGQGADETFGGYMYLISDMVMKDRWMDIFESWRKGKMQQGIRRKLEIVLKKLGLMLIGCDIYAEISSGYDIGTSFSERLRVERKTRLQNLLTWMDRESMAHGVESRMPFMDYRIVEYMGHVYSGALISEGTTKLVLREAMREIVPKEILERRDKRGWPVPEEVWLNGKAKEWCIKKIGYRERDYRKKLYEINRKHCWDHLIALTDQQSGGF